MNMDSVYKISLCASIATALFVAAYVINAVWG